MGDDGIYYSKEEFVGHFGGTKEWDEATGRAARWAVQPLPAGTGVTSSALTALGGGVAAALKARRGETLAVFEATTGGLVNAALQSVPGASSYYVGGGIVYSGKAAKGLFPTAVIEATQMMNRGNYANRETYIKSKEVWATSVARGMKAQMRTAWCVAESGATGPAVLSGRPEHGLPFTAIAVSGPGVEACVVVESDHSDREGNMWQFAAAALRLLKDCVDAAGRAAPEAKL